MTLQRIITWLLLPALATIITIFAPPTTPAENWVYPLIAGLWLAAVVALWPNRIQTSIRRTLSSLRARPVLHWLVLLLYVCLTLVAWIVPYQPTNGRPLTGPEYVYLIAILFFFVYIALYGLDSDQARHMGHKLGQSRWSGVLVTLTTIIIIFIAAETYMRLFYITTDGYGFTAMNYHWYKNFYWGKVNSLGYRDYEPVTDADVTRIAILGDSFAMGHGINNLDDTFPQLLEQQLGHGYDVNVIAQSGWDSDIELHYLQEYPLRPDVVILSYYLNDIDHLLTDPTQNPDAVFDFPDNDMLYWVVLNFFVPNYLYYNILQFTSPARNTDFTARLIDAHMNDDIWAQQAWWLNEMTTWTNDNDVQMMVLLWPQIAAVEASIPATQRVRDFFQERDVPVIDMTEALIDQDPRQMIVNRFDSHPGIGAQHLAADALQRTFVEMNAAD